DNFLPGTRTNVFTYKPVSVPDWTAVPSPAPAAFDFKIVFDTVWPYIGTSALVWNLTYDSGGPNQAITDRHLVSAGPTATNGTAFGTGCVATGNVAAFGHTLTLSNFGPAGGMALSGATSSGPASAAVTLLLDVVNSSLTIPGLCTVLYV